MTHYVLRSKVADPELFQQQVQALCDAMVAYEVHRTRVAAGEAQHYPSPAQGMDPDIAACVRWAEHPKGVFQFEIDYQLVDYLPVAPGDEAALLARKQQLSHDLLLMQEVSIHRVLPARKWRYATLLYTQAVNKAKTEMTAADLTVIAEHTERLKQLERIHLHYAQQESEVEDLDFTSINNFRLEAFKA